MGLRRFLDKHWKPLVFISLCAGLAGWLVTLWTAYGAYKTTHVYDKWEIMIDMNHYGEGPFELFVLFPSVIIMISLAIYTFYRKMGAE